MNNNPLLEEYKIQASILLKQLKSKDLSIAEKAIARIRVLPIFALGLNGSIKRKHALNVIAIENGFNNWAELKTHFEKPKTDFYLNGFLNKWFSTYEEAKFHQESYGGFLLPYKHQFFICEKEYIQALGLDPNHPDFELIGFDLVKPKDLLAWKRIGLKLAKLNIVR